MGSVSSTSGAVSFKAISAEEIVNARTVIGEFVTRTPIKACPPALEVPGTQLFLKLENEQRTGSFKIRGALNKMKSLTAEERARGVVASSAGNHAQGVALAAKMIGVQATIVMPVNAPIVKVDGTKAYGANVILKGEFYDEAYAHALELEKSKGYIFVHPYQDAKIIAGQGTIGLEILEEIPDLDSIVVPIGGGGLISGIATAVKALRPSCKIFGVVSNQAPGMMYMAKGQTWDPSAKKRIATIAEGIAIKNPSKLMAETYISRLVDDIVEVTDDEVAQAIVFLLEKGKTVVEGSGAAGLAAVMSNRFQLGAKSCVLLCGGNIDLNIISKVIERGQRRNHRLARIAVVVDDLPGNLHRLTGVFAEHMSNVLEVYHDRVSPELGLRETRIDFLVETSSDEHIQNILGALKIVGCRILSANAT